MDPASQRPKGRDDALSKLNDAIEDLNRAKEIANITPAKVVFGATSDLLPTIRDSMIDGQGYVELGLYCAEVCRSLDRGLNHRQADQLGRLVLEAIGQLTTTVAQIQKSTIELKKRNPISRIFYVKKDEATIAAWRSDLDRILHVFETELALHTHVAVSDVRGLVSDIHRAVMKGQEGVDIENQTTRASVLGEPPPPPPGAFFGRDELIEKIVGLAESLTPIALIGAGGIGKTSIALSVLHDSRVKKRFNENRRFIRCEQFQPTRADFLNHLSIAIGAGVENPKDLTPLRRFLSSKEMFLVLDNAESVLDPQGTDARDIYAMVEELSRFGNICLCITSRISTVPPRCRRPKIPTLSMESACDIFYDIYRGSGRSDVVKQLIQELDFHTLSITLLATTAAHNAWDHNRLAREWSTHRARALRTYYNESLEATIELSLASPTFRDLGSIAREILGVIAFFPQGINENNLDWLFPTIHNRTAIFDKLCALSLTHRSNNFITMLAPLRDYLSPQDPRTSPLLCTTKDLYFSRLRLLDDLEPDQPGFGESRWITSEDTNVEHLLNIFTSFDTDSGDTWAACADFMTHLRWHKPRSTVLGSRVEGLSDDHHSKPRCLFQLSQLFKLLGNYMDQKQLLTRVLELERARGGDDRVARTLRELAEANRLLNLNKEGIQQSREALEICERLGDAVGQAKCWDFIGWSLFGDGQLNAAEEAGSHALNLFRDQDRGYWVCICHRLLGLIYQSKGERGKAVQHFEAAIGIASPFDWHSQLFWNYLNLAILFCNEKEFDNAQPHIEQAKSHAVDSKYRLGRAMDWQAEIWYRQGRLREAKAENFHALETFEKLGATADIQWSRSRLRNIELALERR